MMLGLMMISASEAIRPVANPRTAPVVLNRFQNSESTMTGKFAEAEPLFLMHQAIQQKAWDLRTGRAGVLRRDPFSCRQ